VAGIAMSGLNAFFIVWWLTVGSLLLFKFVGVVGVWGIPFFIIVHWLCDLVWLTFVSFTIFKTHKFWAQKYQEYIFVVLGLFLGYFGLQFIFQGIDVFTGSNIWGWAHYVVLGLAGLALVWLVVNAVKNRKDQRETAS
jgi:threonine/homoserine/homoserine lactone efflux protein